MSTPTIPGAAEAIRAGFGVALYQSNLNNSSSLASDAVINITKNRIETFAKSINSASSTSMTQLIEDNMDLIQLSMKAAIFAIQAFSEHMKATTEHRKRFEEELQLNIATFTIPGDLESKNLSLEHKAVERFLTKLNQFPALFAYSGVKKIVDTEDNRTRRMCALPLYSIHQLEHPSASPRDLDQARIAISLFFNSKATRALQNMTDMFSQDNRATIFFESWWEELNYLNDLRAPRFILTVLFNILWNLQHPIDCKTGYSLPLNESIRLCSQFNALLNIYLADEMSDSPYKNDFKRHCFRIVRQIELKANNLYLGYIDEKLRQFNLKSLTNNAHLTLRELDTSLFQLIFKTRDNHPNQQAALDIADSIGLLNDLLDKNPAFFDVFDEQRKKIPGIFLTNTYLNPESCTVIDALIIFCHLTNKQRQILIESIYALPDAGENGYSLAEELSMFENDYILPLEKSLLTKQPHNSSDPSSLAKYSALKLVPLFTLVAADFRIKVDTRKSLSRIKEITDHDGISPYNAGNEQVQLINNTAQEYSSRPKGQASSHQVYHWSISTFMKLTPEAAESIDHLPSKQYRMTQITELLDFISELTLSYKSFLQYKTFQSFLLDCLQRVDSEYRQFAEEATLVEQLLSLDGKLDRALKNILQTMITQLSDNLSAFRQSIDEISHIVGAPDFTELRKQELDKHIKRIEKKFVQLFRKEPINFTNTYQQILCHRDTSTIRSNRIDKTKQLFDFVLQFFEECKQVLLQHQPSLPKAPHFLSCLKQDKVSKYMSLIDYSIEHVERLVSDNNFLLNTPGLLSQLKRIDGNQTFNRTEEQIKKSTYCQVIIEELIRRWNLQSIKDKTPLPSQSLDPSQLYDSTPFRRTTYSLLPHSSMRQTAPIISPMAAYSEHSLPSSVPMHSSEQEQEHPEQAQEEEENHHIRPLLNAYSDLRNELKSTLQIYLSSKENEQPTHWFFQQLQMIKNWFGYLCNFIYVRLLDTKIEVAQKVLNTLESDESSSTKLALTSLEMQTLTNGDLGTRTYYFRTHAFWSEFAEETDETYEIDLTP